MLRPNTNDNSYNRKLSSGDNNLILKRIGEEAAEVVMTCKNDNLEVIASEVADLFYHTLVALA